MPLSKKYYQAEAQRLNKAFREIEHIEDSTSKTLAYGALFALMADYANDARADNSRFDKDKFFDAALGYNYSEKLRAYERGEL
jgi:hypothetical protein